MRMSQTHTPGEWRMESFQHGQHGYSAEVRCGETAICECYGLGSFAHGNAERIVLCCNAHDDLVAAMKAFFEASWDALGDLYGSRFSIDDNDMSDRARIIRAYVSASDKIRSALAKAGEK